MSLLITRKQNGTTFGPIAPNAGSNAPVTGGGGSTPPPCPNSSTCSTDAFAANTGFNNRANVWSQQTGNKVIIEQIGSYNVITVGQSGRKNYSEIDIIGSNNSVTTIQTSGLTSATNYMEISVNGSNNTIENRQNSTGGAKGSMTTVNNNNNQVEIWQKDNGNHYAEINVSGGSKTVGVIQEGSGSHMAKITLTGGATTINTTQSGSTQQFYSITHSCAQASCAAITVTQGQ